MVPWPPNKQQPSVKEILRDTEYFGIPNTVLTRDILHMQEVLLECYFFRSKVMLLTDPLYPFLDVGQGMKQVWDGIYLINVAAKL